MKKLNENKRRSIKFTSRFFALMTILLGIGSIFMFVTLKETDITGPIFIILLGILGYIGTFGEDK